MNEEDLRVAAIAEHQYGTFARSQAAQCGLSESSMTRRVMTGDWIAILPGVYRLPGAPRTGRQLAKAATLWGGDEVVVSHQTAARLLRLDGILTDGVHLTVPSRSGLANDAVRVHRTRTLDKVDRREVDGIPCTSATRTLIDCAPVLDDETLETAFEHARRLGLTTRNALAKRAAALCGSGRPGSSRIRALLASVDRAALESRLEVRTRRLLRGSSLPDPIPQYRLGRFRIDFAWPDFRVGCECDGFETHGYRLAWKRDRRRLAALEAAAWRIVAVTWEDVTKRPDETLERIALALRNAV